MGQTTEMRESKFYKSRKIFDNVTLISGLAGEQCYLVEGSERALLIDGLTGVGSLRAYIRELTDLPVLMVVTHGHLDHIGAAFEYKECFIHPEDIALILSGMHSDKEARLEFATKKPREGITLQDVVPAVPVKTYPVYDGDSFDLGSVELEVIAVPGHTRGTIVLLDRANRAVYSGDACNLNTLLNLPGSASIEEYLESLRHFKGYEGDFDVMWGGHGGKAVPKSAVEDGIRLCEEILAGKDDRIAVPPTSKRSKENCLLAKKRGENYLPAEGGYCNIVYTLDGLRRAEKQPIRGIPYQG